MIATNLRGETQLKDQCAWYGISYLIDTTLGLVLALVFVRLLDNVANERNWASLKNSGVYTGPHGFYHWVSQCIAWVAILTIVKIIIYVFMIACAPWLAWIGAILFAPLQGNIRFELVFVMILFPGLLNVIYFWIADGFLKAQKTHEGAHEEADPKTESLMPETEQEMSDYQPPKWSSVSQPETTSPTTETAPSANV